MAYIAKGNINHDGVFYKAGDTVKNLSEEQANTLIEAGVISNSAEVESSQDVEKDAPSTPTQVTENQNTKTDFPPADVEKGAPDASKEL